MLPFGLLRNPLHPTKYKPMATTEDAVNNSVPKRVGALVVAALALGILFAKINTAAKSTPETMSYRVKVDGWNDGVSSIKQGTTPVATATATPAAPVTAAATAAPHGELGELGDDTVIAIICNFKYGSLTVQFLNDLVDPNLGNYTGKIALVIGSDMTEAQRTMFKTTYNIMLIDHDWSTHLENAKVICPRNFDQSTDFPSFHFAKIDLLLNAELRKFRWVAYFDTDQRVLRPLDGLFATLRSEIAAAPGTVMVSKAAFGGKSNWINFCLPSHGGPKPHYSRSSRKTTVPFCAKEMNRIHSIEEYDGKTTTSWESEFMSQYPNPGPFLETSIMLFDITHLPDPGELKKAYDDLVAKHYQVMSIWYEQGFITLPFWGRIATMPADAATNYVSHLGAHKMKGIQPKCSH